MRSVKKITKKVSKKLKVFFSKYTPPNKAIDKRGVKLGGWGIKRNKLATKIQTSKDQKESFTFSTESFIKKFYSRAFCCHLQKPF